MKTKALLSIPTLLLLGSSITQPGSISVPYTVWPQGLSGVSGAGTEASPWTQADNTGGIQTALNSLSARGGAVRLPAGRFNLSAAITITQTGAAVTGEAAGFSPNNAEAEPTTGTKLARSTTGNVYQIGSASAGARPGGDVIRNQCWWGSGRTPGSYPYTGNAAAVFSGYTDQTTVEGVRIGNFGVAVHMTTNGHWTDAATFRRLSIHGNGYGVFLASGGTSWFSSITQNQISDNDYHAIYAEASGDTTDNNFIRGNTIVRNCRVSGCTSNPSNLYWARSQSLIDANQITDAGVCLNGSPNCPGGGSSRLADEVYIAGSYNRVSNNHIGRASVFTGASCVKLSGNNNVVEHNTFRNCDTDVTILSGASDNVINQPGVKISDAGTRTVVNGVAQNAGDPDVTGAWNGVAKWPGLTIYDTIGTTYYYYQSASVRTTLGGGSGNATQVNGAAVPVSQPCVGSNAAGQLIASSCSGTGGLAIATPYLSDGTNYFVAATGYRATLPTAPTWLNSISPTFATFGANGDYVIYGSGNYWASYTGISSVECEFSFTAQATGSNHYPGAGVWMLDSTNNRIWWWHPYVYTGASGDATGYALALETWTYNGSGNPTFSGSTNLHYPYFPSNPLHLKLSVSGGTLTAAVSLNGGQTVIPWVTETVGTTTQGGFSSHGDNSQNAIMDVFSIKAQ